MVFTRNKEERIVIGCLVVLCIASNWSKINEMKYQYEQKVDQPKNEKENEQSEMPPDVVKMEPPDVAKMESRAEVAKVVSEISAPELDSFGTCGKGEKFSKDWLKQEFAEFVKVYDKRPRGENSGGTKMVHQFAAWASIR